MVKKVKKIKKILLEKEQLWKEMADSEIWAALGAQLVGVDLRYTCGPGQRDWDSGAGIAEQEVLAKHFKSSKAIHLSVTQCQRRDSGRRGKKRSQYWSLLLNFHVGFAIVSLGNVHKVIYIFITPLWLLLHAASHSRFASASHLNLVYLMDGFTSAPSCMWSQK